MGVEHTERAASFKIINEDKSEIIRKVRKINCWLGANESVYGIG